MNLLPHLINGVALGILFGLLALGFMLIVGVMEVINLAHGSLFALGAYVAMELVTPRFGPPGEGYAALPLPLRYAIALVVAPAVIGVVGMALERLVRRTYGKKAEYGLLLTFGAALVLEEGIRIVWGKGEQHLEHWAKVLETVSQSMFRLVARIHSQESYETEALIAGQPGLRKTNEHKKTLTR